MNEKERQDFIARTSQPSPRIAGGEGGLGRIPASLRGPFRSSGGEDGNNDRLAIIALAVVLVLLAIFVVMFMWTSDTAGKLVRLGAWLAVAGFLAFGIVAWFMTPRPVKPKR